MKISQVRAFTSRDKFTDTLYSLPVTTDADNSTLIAAVTIPLALLLCSGLAVAVVRRKVCQSSSIEQNLCQTYRLLPLHKIEMISSKFL